MVHDISGRDKTGTCWCIASVYMKSDTVQRWFTVKYEAEPYADGHTCF